MLLPKPNEAFKMRPFDLGGASDEDDESMPIGQGLMARKPLE